MARSEMRLHENKINLFENFVFTSGFVEFYDYIQLCIPFDLTC